jgi:succinate dehydrogenase / fumarate reductase iron-sulfur subunit
MKFNLKIWRQKDANAQGKLVDYKIDNVSEDMSLLELTTTAAKVFAVCAACI